MNELKNYAFIRFRFFLFVLAFIGGLSSFDVHSQVVSPFAIRNQIQQELTIQLSLIANPVTYTWYIYEMETIPNYNGQQNFVSKIYWRYNAVSNDGFVANIESISTFNEQNGTNYTQYSDLTQDLVIGWLEVTNNMSELQYKLDCIINEKRNPPVVVLPLPW